MSNEPETLANRNGGALPGFVHRLSAGEGLPARHLLAGFGHSDCIGHLLIHLERKMIQPIDSAEHALHEADALPNFFHPETHLILRVLIYCAFMLEKIYAKVEPLR